MTSGTAGRSDGGPSRGLVRSLGLIMTLCAACEPAPELGAPIPPDAAPCEGAITQAPPDSAWRELPVRLIVADDVPTDAAARVVGQLRGYLERWRVGLRLEGSSRRPIWPLLGARSADLVGAATAPESSTKSWGGPASPTLGGAGAADAADVLYGDLRAWVRASSRPVRPGVDLVIVRELAPPGSVAGELLGTRGGLGMTPAVCQGEAAIVCQELAAEGPFQPTVFLAVEGIERLGAAGRWTAPHELGHALGLSHVASGGNLMAPSGTSCLPGLDPSQQATLRAATHAPR